MFGFRICSVVSSFGLSKWVEFIVSTFRSISATNEVVLSSLVKCDIRVALLSFGILGLFVWLFKVSFKFILLELSFKISLFVVLEKFKDIDLMPCSSNVFNSLLWEMPSSFKSCQILSLEKFSSRESIFPSLLVSCKDKAW